VRLGWRLHGAHGELRANAGQVRAWPFMFVPGRYGDAS
jgi:hypothetical protein